MFETTDIVKKSPEAVRKSRSGRFREVLADPRTRSRISNASELLANIDGRSAIARRYRDILAQVVVDQGDTGISETLMQLIRRFSATCVMAEALETELVEGRKVNVENHALLCSTMVRLAGRIGIDLKTKTVGPAGSLSAYLDGRAAAPDDAVAAPASDAEISGDTHSGPPETDDAEPDDDGGDHD
jgi:hypothetical protein